MSILDDAIAKRMTPAECETICEEWSDAAYEIEYMLSLRCPHGRRFSNHYDYDIDIDFCMTCAIDNQGDEKYHFLKEGS